MIDVNATTNIFPEWKVTPYYKIKKVLGEGSYGAVALATHIASGQQVAIKKISDVFANKGDCKRIFREVKLACHLSHPGIVQIFEIFAEEDDLEKNGVLYIVMEVTSSDLGKIVRGGTEVSLD